MALVNRCWFNSTSKGTADFTVGTAVPGALVPSSAGAINGGMYSYVAVDPTDVTSWEIGIGTNNGAVTWTPQPASMQFNNSFGSATTTVNAPTGLTAGDIIVIVASQNATNASIASPPSGFMLEASETSSTDGVSVFIMWKVAGASEPSSYTTTFGASSTVSSVAFRVSVSGGNNPSFVSSAVSKHDNGDFPTSITFPTLGSLPADALIICGAYWNNDGAANGTLDSRLTKIMVGDGTGGTTRNAIGAATASGSSPAYTYVGGGGGSAWAEATVAIAATPEASWSRTIIVASSNGGAKVDFANNPQIQITALAGLDFGNQAPVTITGSTYAVDSGSISGVPFDTDLICNGSGTITLTLPSAAAWPGRKITVRTIAAETVVSASSNVVPAAGGSPGTAILAGTAGKSALLQSDGTNWQIQLSN